MIVRAAPRDHLGWIVDRAGCALSEYARGIEAVDASGRVHGMTVMDMWTFNAVFVHIALDNPASFRELMRATFHYCFVQSNRGVMLATIRDTNTRSKRLVEHLGFTLEHRVKDGIALGEDLLMYRMDRAACRWLPARKAA